MQNLVVKIFLNCQVLDFFWGGDMNHIGAGFTHF